MGVRMCMFGVCVVSAYAFMSAVGMYVCECICAYFFACVRACVYQMSHNFFLNWLPQRKTMHYHNKRARVIFILTVPRRYFCCGSLLLFVLDVCIYTLVQLLC